MAIREARCCWFFFFKCLTEFHILHKQQENEERRRHRSAVSTAGELKAQRWLWFKRLEVFKLVDGDAGKGLKLKTAEDAWKD